MIVLESLVVSRSGVDGWQPLRTGSNTPITLKRETIESLANE